MKLVEAVRKAREEGYKWLAIDSYMDINSYNNKPVFDDWDDSWYEETHNPLGICSTPLGGNRGEDWLIELKEIKILQVMK